MNGIEWKYAMISASNNLGNFKNTVDRLNVFPVPDGDTGTNMHATINAAKEYLTNLDESQCVHIGKLTSSIAQQMLLGARGNSGVILSQIFRGFSLSLADKKTIETKDIIKAFKSAKETAYKAVLKPVEGTLLTVIRETSEYLSQLDEKTSIPELFALAYEEALKSCNNTPNLLPVLKEVGVVDSGGYGLVKIIEGLSLFFQNKPVELSDQGEESDINALISETEIFEGEFGYCTEFIINLDKPNKFNKEYLIKKLEKIGNSLVVVNDESYLKVHIHALKPGNVLNSVQSLGEFIKIKIENMTQQANNSKKHVEKERSKKSTGVTQEIDMNEIISAKSGLISCHSGRGMSNIAKEFGAHWIIEGGQTNNPSTKDIIEAINKIEAETIFILPNNSNIILSAQQAAQIVENEKNVVIIPTKTQVEGINAVMNFNEENLALDNEENMLDAIKSTKSAEVTYAVKNTKIDGMKIKKGQFLAITDHKVLSTHRDANEAAIALFDELIDENSEMVTIYYGQDASESDANELKNYIESTYDVEVEIYNGEQALYPYFISVE
ncbi:DAK2 domain-containing protein [Mycoplasma phocoenae]|uniref:DAK2 domain-containing protein n=1 Tax=Mycoplasma phocoenae TaxID=754517 RepID=A0A858U468_9MOLU|nr:DAK2 domain-containing protein [Mycoplasma phocoenae]QJG67242.1 DAK2 domain-containing protein [Mycoplasma phocoenae]